MIQVIHDFHIGKLIKLTNSGPLSKRGGATTHGEEVLSHFSCG